MISGFVDLDRGGHSRHENDALRHLIDVDAHGDSLREPHPGEDRIDDGNALPVRLRIGDVDRAIDVGVTTRKCTLRTIDGNVRGTLSFEQRSSVAGASRCMARFRPTAQSRA
jgi:hypothetical protein